MATAAKEFDGSNAGHLAQKYISPGQGRTVFGSNPYIYGRQDLLAEQQQFLFAVPPSHSGSYNVFFIGSAVLWYRERLDVTE